MSELSKKDWTLLAVAAGGEAGLTPAQLQKSLFLLVKAYPELETNYYNFEPYNYGPFDKVIYSDADELAADHLIDEISSTGRTWVQYRITDEGRKAAADISSEISPKPILYLAAVVRWAQSLSFQELIASVYKQYPSYRANSVFRD